VSFTAPAACEYFHVPNNSAYGVGLYFLIGIIGMATAQLILEALDHTRLNVPNFISKIFKYLLIKIKNLLNVTQDAESETKQSTDDSGRDSPISGGGAVNSTTQ
jgi:hypothetical protein